MSEIEATWEDRLNPYERELLALLRDSRTTWPTLYLCLRHMQSKFLYQGPGFSQWLHRFCYRAGCSTSRLWDALRAGKIYEAWTTGRSDVPKIENLDFDPQNLIVAERIVKLDPSRKEVLLMKILNKEVKRRELLDEVVRLKFRIQQEGLGHSSWRDQNMSQPPYFKEYRSLLEIIDMYYDNATVDGCRQIVDALKACVEQIKETQIQHG